jgi:hypothetical protein
VVAVLIEDEAGATERVAFAARVAGVELDAPDGWRTGWVLTASGRVGRFVAPAVRGPCRGCWLAGGAAPRAQVERALAPHLRRLAGSAEVLLQVGIAGRDGRPRWTTIASGAVAADRPLPDLGVAERAPLPLRAVLCDADKLWECVRL